MSERIILFRHNYSCDQILIPVNNVIDINDETIIEIVLSGKFLFINQLCTNKLGYLRYLFKLFLAQLLSEEYESVTIKPHALAVHSYKTPTFCDYCGQMLFGIVRQGLKCSGIFK